ALPRSLASPAFAGKNSTSLLRCGAAHQGQKRNVSSTEPAHCGHSCTAASSRRSVARASGFGYLRLGRAAVHANRSREHLGLDPLAVALEQLALARRERHLDAVGELEAGVLAHRVQPVDQVEDAALELELRVERRVE